VSSSGLYSAVMAVLLGVLVGVGILLSRYRDRLHNAFGPQTKTFKKTVDVAPGVKLVVAEIDGMKVICGLNKTGITAMQIIGPAHGDQS
jgi:hypothetical protein